MQRRILQAALAASAATLGGAAIAQYVMTPSEVEQARQAIWAKEMSIYEGRSRGLVDYYVANASPRFLAWTAGSPAPFDISKLKAGRDMMRGRDKELIKTTFRGFTLSGDTAIIYYQNHRTRSPDGEAVDQTYDNIHVWQKTDGDWKVLASMSRQVKAAP